MGKPLFNTMASTTKDAKDADGCDDGEEAGGFRHEKQEQTGFAKDKHETRRGSPRLVVTCPVSMAETLEDARHPLVVDHALVDRPLGISSHALRSRPVLLVVARHDAAQLADSRIKIRTRPDHHVHQAFDHLAVRKRLLALL